MGSKVNLHATKYLKSDDLKTALMASFHTNVTCRQTSPAEICARVVNKKTGKVDRKKLFSMLQYKYFVGIGLEGVMHAMFDGIDHNKDGQIYYTDFVQTFLPRVDLRKDRHPLTKLFAANPADANRSNSINSNSSSGSDSGGTCGPETAIAMEQRQKQHTKFLLEPTPPPSSSNRLHPTLRNELRPPTPAVGPWASKQLVVSKPKPSRTNLVKTIANGLR